jgi:hypothetical protein
MCVREKAIPSRLHWHLGSRHVYDPSTFASGRFVAPVANGSPVAYGQKRIRMCLLASCGTIA